MSETSADDLSMTALEYALGTLPAGERAAFARQLATEAAARTALAEWEQKLAPMAAAVEPVEPDAAVLRGIEQRLDPPASGGNVVALRTSVIRWRTAATAMSALAASLALYVAFKPTPEIARPTQTAAVQTAPVAAPSAPPMRESGVTTASGSRKNEDLVVTASGPRETSIRGGLNLPPSREADSTPSLVAALTPPSAPVALIARVDPAANTLTVRRLSAPVPAGSVLRLWLVAANGSPRSLGILADETTKLALPRDIPLAGATIAVTVEPSGAAMDTPAGPFVYEGKLVRE